MSSFPFAAGSAFDVVVVGGGIIGAGIARDAALRGLSVALVERADFGGGTTAGSTRLIHGGLRYLEMLDFRLVRMDLREREILLRLAPHLVRPLEFLVPFYDRSLFYRAKLRAGMLLYDGLSYDRSLPGHRFLSARETLRREPNLRGNGLQGAASYYDAQINSPERLCMENLLDAREHGAVTSNYTEVIGALRSAGVLCGVHVRHTLTGEESELRAKIVVNASGPWFDRVAASLEEDHTSLIRTTKGIHVACEPVSRNAMVLFAADGRLFFVIPWLGYSWVGTTDTDYRDDPADVRATAADVAYLMRAATPFFPALLSGKVMWSNAGVRALVKQRGSESSVSRLHRIVTNVPGLVSVAGGKITGYRAIAQDAVDAVCRALGSAAKCVTHVTPLPGGRGPLRRGHLDSLYGAQAEEVRRIAETDPSLARPLAPDYPDIAAQVVYAVRREQCVRLSDFLLRRTLMGFSLDQGARAAVPAAELMARALGWSTTTMDAEIDHFRRWTEQTQDFRGGPAELLRR